MTVGTIEIVVNGNASLTIENVIGFQTTGANGGIVTIAPSISVPFALEFEDGFLDWPSSVSDASNGNLTFENSPLSGTAFAALGALEEERSVPTETIAGDMDVANELYGSIENEVLVGGNLDDALFGGSAADILIGGEGGDHLDGGSGKDTASYANAASGVRVSVTGTLVDASGEEVGDTLISIENLIGSDFDDVLYGNEADNVLWGGAGNDRLRDGLWNDYQLGWHNHPMTFDDRRNELYGGDGDDEILATFGNNILDGGAGNDILTTYIGYDLLYGGDGDDLLVNVGFEWEPDFEPNVYESGNGIYDGGAGTDTFETQSRMDAFVDLAGGQAVWEESGDSVQLISIENVTGFYGDDTIFGNDVDNILNGFYGDDVLVGGGGNDTLIGDHGDDVLRGGEGNDILIGGDGDDRLFGGAGIDTVKISALSTMMTYDVVDGGIRATIAEGHPDPNFNSDYGSFVIYDDVEFIEFADVTLTYAEVAGPLLTEFEVIDDFIQTDEGGSTVIDVTENDLELNGDPISVVSVGGTTMSPGTVIRLDSGATLTMLPDGTLEFDQGGAYAWLDAGQTAIETVTYTATDSSGVEKAGSITLVVEGADSNPNSAHLDRNAFIASTDPDKASKNSIANFNIAASILVVDEVFVDPNNPPAGVTIEEINGDTYVMFGGDDAIVLEDVSLDAWKHVAANPTVTGTDDNDVLIGDAGNNSLYGREGDDYVLGGAGDDNLHGSEGNDELIGGSGNDQIFGDDGDDILVGGDGDDYFRGGLGQDKYDGGDGVDTVDLQDDIASLNGPGVYVDLNEGIVQWLNNQNGVEQLVSIENVYGTRGDDILIGDDGNNRIDGVSGNDILRGGAGDDTLTDAYGDNQLYGGTGDDVLLVTGNGSNQLFGEDGNDTLTGGDGFDSLAGGAGNDLLKGRGGDDTYLIDLGDTNDIIHEGNGNSFGDRIVFGVGITSQMIDLSVSDADADGFDNIVLSIAGTSQTVTIEDTFYATDATNLAVEFLEFADGTVVDLGALYSSTRYGGTAGNDNYTGTGLSETMHGLGGNDSLSGGFGNDTLYGGDGNDTLLGEDGDDHLIGGSGNESLQGGEGNDRYYIELGDGEDFIWDLNGADDRVVFGAGITQDMLELSVSDSDGDGANNIVIAISGTTQTVTLEDMFYEDSNFNLAIETLQFSDGSVVLLEDFYSSKNFSGTGDDDTYVGTEFDDIMHGQDGSDTLSGGVGDDSIHGGNGNDTIDGGEGDDNHYGGDGDDLILGSLGDDFFDGGTGRDTIDFSYSSSNFNLDLSQSNVVFDSGFTEQVLNFENIIGGSGNNTLVGSEDSNILQGLGGDDIYTTGAGNDTIRVETGSGADIVTDFDPDNDLIEINGIALDPNNVPVGVTVNQNGNDVTISFGPGDTLTLQNVDFAAWQSAANSSPTMDAVDDAATLTEDGTILIDVLANDTGAVNISSISTAVNGSASIEDGKIRFTPSTDFHGSETLTYTVDDGNGETDTATVTVTVSPENDAPTASNDVADVTEDGSVLIDVFANDLDVDGDPLTITAVAGSLNGAASIENGQIRYNPNADFHGTETLTYSVEDGNGGTDAGTISVTVTPENDNPVASNNTASVAEDGTILIDALANDLDVDGDTLTINNVTGALNGIANIEDGQIRYTPNSNFNGIETLTYSVGDGNGGTATATIAVTVTPENDTPEALNDAASLDEDGTVLIDVLANDTDPDGDVLTISNVTGASSGVAVIEGGQIRYTPDSGFSGTDTVNYTISDGAGGVASATAAIDVNPVQTGPTPFGEAGSITVSQSSADQWHTVSFGATILNAVVVMGPLTSNDDDPATARVRNVTDTSFEFQIDEYEYLDGVHGAETIGWLAVSEGTHTLANGSTIVAGNASVGTSYTSVDFGTSLTDAVVLHQVSSVNDPDAVVSRIRNSDADGFQARIREQEQGTSHVSEDLSWIAIETGSGSGFEAVLSGDQVGHSADEFLFSETFADTPVILGDLQTRDGGDTSVLRLDAADHDSLSIYVDEEQSKDSETNHTNEVAGWFALEDGFLI
ncbi:Ig-like domain-containing protein [Ruegeria atlantica]|uniref:Ig-like domain-containing protein n=1 Tax=Ruegeria atlantica TaxID=81569 RepID=UPI0024950E5E|nr:Ig-like domain-containing protein [Ruegeria atlantica]